MVPEVEMEEIEEDWNLSPRGKELAIAEGRVLSQMNHIEDLIKKNIEVPDSLIDELERATEILEQTREKYGV